MLLGKPWAKSLTAFLLLDWVDRSCIRREHRNHAQMPNIHRDSGTLENNKTKLRKTLLKPRALTRGAKGTLPGHAWCTTSIQWENQGGLCSDLPGNRGSWHPIPISRQIDSCVFLHPSQPCRLILATSSRTSRAHVSHHYEEEQRCSIFPRDSDRFCDFHRALETVGLNAGDHEARDDMNYINIP